MPYFEVRITVDSTIIAELDDSDEAIEHAWNEIMSSSEYGVDVREIIIASEVNLKLVKREDYTDGKDA